MARPKIVVPPLSLYEATSLNDIARHFMKLRDKALVYQECAPNDLQAALYEREASVWSRAAIVLRQTTMVEPKILERVKKDEPD